MSKGINTQEIGQMYNSLAENYNTKKRESMINLLYCGKILHDAKKSLPHGMFSNFLADPRVSESERTAQRLMSVNKNFGHLLSDPENKIRTLEHLGVSHLLELQKLPKRFKKNVEIESEVDGELVKEKAEVIDEQKLSDFLGKNVDYKGEKKKIRDLPLDEMKVYINAAQGVYEPSKELLEEDSIKNEGGYSEEQKANTETRFDPILGEVPLKPEESNEEVQLDTLDNSDSNPLQLLETDLNELRKKLSDFTINVNDINSRIQTFKGRDDLDELSYEAKGSTLKEISNIKSRTETMLILLMDMEEKLN